MKSINVNSGHKMPSEDRQFYYEMAAAAVLSVAIVLVAA